MIEAQRNQFFAMKKGEPTVIKSFGKKLSLSNFPTDTRRQVLKRLAEKDEVMNRGLSGEVPGLKIDGKQVTVDNIKDFEVKPKQVKEVVEEKVVEEKEPMTKSDLEKLSFGELKKIAKTFGETGRSKKGVIKDILKHL